MLLVLGCNTLSAMSYMVRITATPYIFAAKKVVAYVEMVVYLLVPLALPIKKIWSTLRQKIFGESLDEPGDDMKKNE